MSKKHMVQTISETLNMLKGMVLDLAGSNGMGEERNLSVFSNCVHRESVFAYKAILQMLVQKSLIISCKCQRDLDAALFDLNKSDTEKNRERFKKLKDLQRLCECGGTGWKDFLDVKEIKPSKKQPGDQEDDGGGTDQGEGETRQ